MSVGNVDRPEVDPRSAMPFEVYSVEFSFPGSGAIPLKHHALSAPTPPSNSYESGGLLTSFLGGTTVPIPEYITGVRSEPAAFLIVTRPRIRAVFRKLSADAEGSYTIGAVGGFGGLLENPAYLQFPVSELSEPIEFDLAQPLPSGIGRFEFALDWTARGSDGLPRPIGSTQHTVYTLLDRPVAPWDVETPWIAALDLACEWAAGAMTKDAVAEAITRGLNSHPLLRYHGATTFDWSVYLLSNFLWLLDRGGVFHLNCTDCANAVVTLANLLGCNLYEGRVFDLTTRRFLKLAGNAGVDADWVSYEWNYHEIAWLEGVGPKSCVYDSCLHVDADVNDEDLLRVPRLPVRMPFPEYRDLLVAKGPCAPTRAPTRRPVA